MWHTVGIQIGIVNGISMFAIGKKNQSNSLGFFREIVISSLLQVRNLSLFL